jgi:acetyl-CoA carboxylase/biotin carboxylase 1
VPWRKSRSILYWRLRRLILQDKVVTALLEAQPLLGVGQGEAMLRRWFVEDKGATEVSFDFTVTVTRCDYCCY